MDRATYLAAHAAVRGAEAFLMDPRREITEIDVGFSERPEVGASAGLMVRVDVAQKKPGPQLEAIGVAPLPGRIDDFPVEINVRTYRLGQWLAATPRAASARGRNDPLVGGISISDDRGFGAGTLGALVRDRATDEDLILSNFHVLGEWGARPGSPRVLQPGRLDGGGGTSAVGSFLRHAMDFHLDAAVARPNGSRGISARIFGIGAIGPLAMPAIGQRLAKYGRSTGLTTGVVTGVAGSARLKYAGIPWLIRSIVAIDPVAPGGLVSGPGDSGSCWVTDEPGHRAVALHFAGTDLPERALAVDLAPVCDALRVDLPA